MGHRNILRVPCKPFVYKFLSKHWGEPVPYKPLNSKFAYTLPEFLFYFDGKKVAPSGYLTVDAAQRHRDTQNLCYLPLHLPDGIKTVFVSESHYKQVVDLMTRKFWDQCSRWFLQEISNVGNNMKLVEQFYQQFDYNADDYDIGNFYRMLLKKGMKKYNRNLCPNDYFEKKPFPFMSITQNDFDRLKPQIRNKSSRQLAPILGVSQKTASRIKKYSQEKPEVINED